MMMMEKASYLRVLNCIKLYCAVSKDFNCIQRYLTDLNCIEQSSTIYLNFIELF